MKQRKDKGRSPAGSPDHHPGKSEDQSSQGDLKHNQGPSADQGSPEVSNSASIGHFRTVDEAIVDLPIKSIQNYQIIPDYRDQTNSKFPIVAQSASSCHCIDGWNLIEGAKSARQSVICCHVFHIENDSETEIAIRKAAIRTMPLGGTCSYAERVRNAGILFNMLWASSENPVVFSHGGARRGDNYTNCRGNNIHLVLAERLGKSVTTINKYLNHGEFLSEQALKTLVSADVSKGFFEAIQESKQSYVAELRLAQTPPDEIARSVSAKVLDWLEKSQAPVAEEIIAPTSTKVKRPLPVCKTVPVAGNPMAKPKRPRELEPQAGSDSKFKDEPLTEDQVRLEIGKVAAELMRIVEVGKLPVSRQIEILKGQIFIIAKLIQHLTHLSKAETDEKEGKV